jgi:dienelactone hydrolase
MKTGANPRNTPVRSSPILIVMFAFVLALASCGGDTTDPDADQIPQNLPSLTSEELLAPGPYSVGNGDLKFVDTSRPTPPNGWHPGAPSRTLRTHVWYPLGAGSSVAAENPKSARAAAGGPFPLIVYTHGFMSRGTEAEHLASYGYIVVSPDFPLTGFFAPGGPNLEDVVNQPGDVSFLIDTFLNLHQDPGSLFHGAVDGSRVGVAGLSLGGMTSSLTTYHAYLRDSRIYAAASIAGPGSMFTEAFYRNSEAPLLALAGDIDAIVDYETNALVTLEMAASKITLVTLRGATHTGFAEAASKFMEHMDNPDLLGCEALTARLSLDVDFPALLGGAEAGIVQRETPMPCTVSPLPTSMRPSRQQELTILAVVSFFESRFGAGRPSRARAARFLRETLAAENQEVTVQ